MPDDKLDIVTVTDRSFLVAKPEAAGKLAHEFPCPLRQFGRDGNAGRITGKWLFDFHSRQPNADAGARQGEERAGDQ